MIQPVPEYMQVPLFTMSPVAQRWALIIFGTISALTLLYAIYRASKERTLRPVIYFIAAAFTCFLEPLLAGLADAAHAQVGQITAFESRMVLVPVHAAVSYTFYFALAYIFLVPAFRDRVYTRRQLWTLLIAIAVIAWVYEVIPIMAGLWMYFGNQPYQLFPSHYLQPLWWTAGSVSLLLVPVTLFARFEQRLSGPRQWLIIPLAPMASFAGAASVSWPTWVALNSPYGPLVKYLGATLTILLTGLLIWLLAPLVTRPATGEARA